MICQILQWGALVVLVRYQFSNGDSAVVLFVPAAVIVHDVDGVDST